MVSIVWLFYRKFWIFTQMAGWGGWLMGGMPLGEDIWDLVGALFWLKLASFGFVWYFMNTFSREQYLFFQNLGYTINGLFIKAFGLDLVIFFGLISLVQWIITVF